ncbi:MAG: hypothetical protein QW764_02855 [Desulfurococcaceae archaeon]
MADKKEKENGKFFEDSIIEQQLQSVLSQIDERTPVPTEETIVLGRLQYMLEDPHIYDLIDKEYPDYKPLKLILSGLSRTTKLDPTEANIIKYRAYTAIDLIQFTKPRDKLSLKELAFVECLKAHVITAVADAINGWRGTLVTEQSKTLRVVPAEQPESHRRWWERLFGR